MDNKKLGIVGLVLVGIFIIFSFLDANNALSFLPDRFGIDDIYYALIIIGAGCWILSNDEHMIFAYADIVIAIMYIIFAFATALIPLETYQELLTPISYVNSAITIWIVINIPLLIRTQSQAHKAIKFVTVLFIILLVVLSLTMKNNVSNVYSSSTSLDSLRTQTKLLQYGLIIVESLLAANPMIAIATSDGLGGGRSSKTPKLVARNQATDPNMAHASTIEGSGINYGGMPVPEGIVANQNFNAIPNDNLNQYVSPEVLDTNAAAVPQEPAAPVNPVAEVAPAPAVEPNPAAPVQPAAAPAPSPAAQVAPDTPEAVPAAPQAPANVINSDNVAAELQSLTNNNQ